MTPVELEGLKRLMIVINDYDNHCPICKDAFSLTMSNYQPVWSDHYDNIVCADCNAKVGQDTECGLA